MHFSKSILLKMCMSEQKKINVINIGGCYKYGKVFDIVLKIILLQTRLTLSS